MFIDYYIYFALLYNIFFACLFSFSVYVLFKPVNISIYVMFVCLNLFPPFSIRLSITGLLWSWYLKSSSKYIIYDFSRLVIILYWAHIYLSIYLFQTHETISGLFPFFFLNLCVYIYLFLGNQIFATLWVLLCWHYYWHV